MRLCGKGIAVGRPLPAGPDGGVETISLAAAHLEYGMITVKRTMREYSHEPNVEQFKLS